MLNEIDDIAGFAAELDFRLQPEAVREHVVWILADTLGAIVGGSVEPEMRALTAAHSDAGPSSIIGAGRAARIEDAAFINGAAGTFLELDEGNRFSRGHPAIHVLPAILALGQERGSHCNDFLSAFLAGYEVASRIGAASNLRPQLHPHGTWGTVGAAVAVGRLVGVSRKEMVQLINISSSLTTASSRRTMLEGGLVRNVYAGLANRNGLLALTLLRAGFEGEQNGLRSVFGGVVGDHYDPDKLIAGLGQQWCATRNYFKLHACCRYNHAALDALDLLAEGGRLPQADSISAIRVETYDLAAELADKAPNNTLAAKFSVPFALATRIVGGASGWRNFTWAEVQNAKIRALAKRIEVHEDPAMTARQPAERPARIVITTMDQTEIVSEVSFNRGDEVAPYSGDKLQEKFMDLTARVWPSDHCNALLKTTLSLGREGASLSAWSSLLGYR